jgi:negative regulator of flagellin synthesis FlgM
MRIGSNIPDLQGVSTERTDNFSSASKARAASPEDSDRFPEDTVSVSALAAKALQMPEVRQDKVDNLRQSVSSGEYQIDPSAIAAAMANEG